MNHDNQLKSHCFNKNNSSLARSRWEILRRSLCEGSKFKADHSSGSTRLFTSFGLVMLVKENSANGARCALIDKKRDEQEGGDLKKLLPREKEGRPIKSTGHWFKCVCKEEPKLELEIRLVTDKVPLKELLLSSDNTGNVCVWPSEEILAYYCLKNRDKFRGKVVTELGGGMTCLAGFVVASSRLADRVILTDGNDRAISNVQEIVLKNQVQFGSTDVHVRQLRWAHEVDYKDLVGKVDIVLSADCVYFDQGRQPLIDTMWTILKETGLSVILAPRRGLTLEHFVRLCQEKGFFVEQVLVYDARVWELHETYLRQKREIYQDNLHYPLMIILRKKQIDS
ncbi:Calmodulin-lysine N-methyltransferase [Halotydeus destructor]|nr:Calmodulin-lysine N-methyltransferase [Halotydeus destructor]